MTDKESIHKKLEHIIQRRLNLLNGEEFDLWLETKGFTNEIVDTIIDSLQEEPVDVGTQIDYQNDAIKNLNSALNSMEHNGHLPKMMTAAESLGISEEEYAKIEDELFEEQEKPSNEDLEEAAKNHAVERYRATRDMVLAEKCKWSFKAGAEWQKEKDYRDGLENDDFLTFAYMDGMEEGKKEMREQMMKDAIGCQVEEGGMCPAMESIPVLTNTDMIQLPKDKFEVGDKVKLIIIKQEE